MPSKTVVSPKIQQEVLAAAFSVNTTNSLHAKMHWPAPGRLLGFTKNLIQMQKKKISGGKMQKMQEWEDWADWALKSVPAEIKKSFSILLLIGVVYLSSKKTLIK